MNKTIAMTILAVLTVRSILATSTASVDKKQLAADTGPSVESTPSAKLDCNQMTDMNQVQKPPEAKSGDEQCSHLYALLKRYLAIQAEAGHTARKLDRLETWKSRDDAYKTKRANMASIMAAIELELPELAKSQKISQSRLDEISAEASHYDVPPKSGLWYGLGLHKFDNANDSVGTSPEADDSSCKRVRSPAPVRHRVQEPCYTSLRDEETLQQLREYASSIYASCNEKRRLIKKGHNGAKLAKGKTSREDGRSTDLRKRAQNNELLPTQASELPPLRKIMSLQDDDFTQEKWSELSSAINAQITKIRDDSRLLKTLVEPSLQQIPIDISLFPHRTRILQQALSRVSAQKAGANFLFAVGEAPAGGRPVSVPLKYVVAEQFAERANAAEARPENTNEHAPDSGAFWHEDDW